MSRQAIIALVGSVAFVLLAFWGVTRMFPAGPAPAAIVGQWAHKGASGCSDAEGYMEVTANAVIFAGKGQTMSPIAIKAFEADANGPRLRAYFQGNLDTFDFYLPYKINGDALTFGTSNWTREARAQYPTQIEQLDALPNSPGKTIYKALQSYQPYHRCAG
jgi:hypothetical protein